MHFAARDSLLEQLTTRQREILALVAKGFTNTEIAELLGLASGTVKLHVSAIIERLEVTNRTEATAVWLGDMLAAQVSENPAKGADAKLCIIHSTTDNQADSLEIAAEIAGYVGSFLEGRNLSVLDPKIAGRFTAVQDSGKILHEQVGVAHSVELKVSLREAGANIDVELVELATGKCLLSDHFAHPLTSTATLVAEISLDIEKALGIGSEEPPTQSAAEECYWQGSYHFAKRTPESLQKAIGYFQSATTTNPQYVPAYVGLANSYHQMAVYAPGMSAFMFPEGIKAANKAIEIEPQNGPAHAALGYAQLFGQWNLNESKRSLDRSLTLNRHHDEALMWKSLWLMFSGDHMGALAVAEEGLALNPIAIAHFVHLGHVYRSQGQLGRAIEHLSKSLDMEPGNLRATIWMALCQSDAGNTHTGQKYIERVLTLYPTAGVILGVSGYIAALSNDESHAKKRLDTLSEISESPTHSPLYEALVNIGLGRFDIAIEQVRASLHQKVPLLLGWYCDPIFRRLAGHPDYFVVGDEIGLPRPA